jgi:putative PIN family toxin of toxin-antitoxin system
VIRVVIDTSVFIRYLIRPSGAIRTLIEELWIHDMIQVVTAPELIAELGDVLRRPRMRQWILPDEGQVLLDAITLKAEIVRTLGPVPPYSRDPKDDKFVACALVGGASTIITTDDDLLALTSLDEVSTVTPEAFIRSLKP